MIDGRGPPALGRAAGRTVDGAVGPGGVHEAEDPVPLFGVGIEAHRAFGRRHGIAGAVLPGEEAGELGAQLRRRRIESDGPFEGGFGGRDVVLGFGPPRHQELVHRAAAGGAGGGARR